MKKVSIVFMLTFLSICQIASAKKITVTNMNELQVANKKAVPGDIIE